MERSPMEMEREIRDAIRRARGSPDKTGSLRRDTLKRLIALTHSPHPNLKILAAQNIRFLFIDFPELEEEAINAVYDLCEDHSAKVRLEGYAAITHLSNEAHRLVRRNADVLVQLLQSEEVDEVIVVKKALTEHLDMDPKVTLSVLCEHIAPLDELADEEEQDIRDRLRSVVLAFLTGEARRAIVERHALPGSEVEEVLINAMLSVIPKLGFSDAEIIVKELLVPLKSFRFPAPRGHALLETLLDKVAEYLQLRTSSGDASWLRSAQPYLDLASFLVVEKRAAPALPLLRLYCSSMPTRMALQKFSKHEQRLVVCRLAETLVVAEDQPQPEDDGPSLAALTRQIVDSTPFLLESLQLSASSPPSSVQACAVLLRACQRRKEKTPWTVPLNLITALRTLQATISEEQSQDVHILIRSLVPSPSASTQAQGNAITQGTTAAPSTSQSVTSTGLSASLSERRPAPYPARRMRIQSTSRPQNRDQATSGSRSIDASTTTTSTSAKHQIVSESSTRPPKRQKSVHDDHDAEAGPSLLSRLGTTLSTGPMPRGRSPGNWTAAQTPRAGATDNLPPSGEWSIRGAAKTGDRNTNLPPPRKSMPPPSQSLLERLEGDRMNMKDDREGRARRHKGRP
ncbi:putative apoptosis inhibitory protein 5 (API5) [Lyophyllum shimeji]|uniref:Apoptosis inhibitory protein 5 (API5) n=1 Tax=Lyophyllum shimeji TaxID=47721 RepID=A0A9P3PKK9_LYOSH|nr:putative apoptosis inhibitory protein 5 (API5) [Lyophyllum shimeji]